jgi:biopolymer transport protein TolR
MQPLLCNSRAAANVEGTQSALDLRTFAAAGVRENRSREGTKMAMTAGARGGLMSNINMTPMIDVLLVLLIIFMIITPMTPEGLPAEIPQPPPPHESPQVNERTVVISVHKNGSLSINQEPVAESSLQQRLIQIFSTRAERVVFVEGAPSLDYYQVARVIDIARGAGVTHVGLLAKQVQNAG